MTLLSIAQAACNAVPIAAPTSIVGNTSNETAMLVLALANAAGDAVTRRPPGGWTSMIREYDFLTVAYGPFPGVVQNSGGVASVTIPPPFPSGPVGTTGWIISGYGLPNNSVVMQVSGFFNQVYITNLPPTAIGAGTYYFSKTDYALPDDFARTVDNTMWDRSRYWSMRGVLSPQEWQAYRSSIFGKATIERRYRFRNSDWLSSNSGTPTVNVFSIDPVPVDNGANLVFEYISSGWCANASTGARQSQWLADTDVSVVPEYLVLLNLKWRLLRRLGVSYNEELDEYEREADKAVARDGATAILDMTPNSLWQLGPYSIQDGNFPSRPMG